MNKNFEIGQSNEVIKAGKIYDLHNMYDFIGININSKDRSMQMRFEPNLEFGKGEVPILITFAEVVYLEFSPNFGAQVISVLDEIGYKKPKDYDDEWLMSEQQATNDDHIFFRLEQGNYVRIYSENADLVEQKESRGQIN